ncbi:MAG: hypothetical protein FJ010_07515 [Chloroflexi bacterium]|nr:hypothetical protein [Chloroflexota bacterium]
MNGIELTYDGKDLTIEKEKLEAIGLRKGDKVELRPDKPKLVPANFSEEEKARRLAILRESWGAWTEEEGEAAIKAIREMRAQWQPRNLS